MKKLISVVTALLVLSCSHSSKTASDGADGSPQDHKISIETSDVVIEGKELQVPIKVRCLENYKTAVLQIGDMYKAFQCENGGFNYTYKFSTDVLKENRKKRKDYILRIRAFHEEKKANTLSQLLVVLSYKDFQSKLVINQALVTIENMDGLFSDLMAHGQCPEGSRVEVEIFDDWRGVSMEEETIPCSESGFAYFSRRPGLMKKGMRLLIRQIKGEKAVASYEVVLFN
jgi:hypothetical protein